MAAQSSQEVATQASFRDQDASLFFFKASDESLWIIPGFLPLTPPRNFPLFKMKAERSFWGIGGW